MLSMFLIACFPLLKHYSEIIAFLSIHFRPYMVSTNKIKVTVIKVVVEFSSFFKNLFTTRLN